MHLQGIAAGPTSGAVGRKTERGPDFICIGMEKAGTGWLYDQFSRADGAWMPPIKELNHFCGDPFTASNLHRLEEVRRRPDLGPRTRAFIHAFDEGRRRGNDAAWYGDLFAIKRELVSGDVSPNYAMATESEIAAAVRECPTARYVLLLRHPVRRLWSALCMRARKGRATTGDLEDWSRLAGIVAQPEYAERSYPTRIWAKWAAAVPRGAIRYWFLEDISREPARVRDEIMAFAGLEHPHVGIPPDYDRKKGQWRMEMPAAVRLRLYEHFADEIRAAAALFGGEAQAWLRDLDATLGTTDAGRGAG